MIKQKHCPLCSDGAFYYIYELLIERRNEIAYEKDGPWSYDRDYKRELKEDGLWEEEVKWWEEHGGEPENHDELSIMLDTLDEILKTFHKVEPERPRYYYDSTV